MIKIHQKNLENEVCRLNEEGYTIESSEKKEEYYTLNYRKNSQKKIVFNEDIPIEEIKVIGKKRFSFEALFGLRK